MGRPKTNAKYIQRFALGVDMYAQGIIVHVAGGHINQHHCKRIRTEVSDTIELELYESDNDGTRTWIVYDYYSPTRAQTKEYIDCPVTYEDIGAKLQNAFNEVFQCGQLLN